MQQRFCTALAGSLLLAGAALAQPSLSNPQAGPGGGVPPANPAIVLYDQMDDPAQNVTSQDFEPAFDIYDNQAADDFVVPAPGWSVTSVDVDGEYSAGGGPTASYNVYFYADAGNLPGALVADRLLQSYTGAAGDASITLVPPVELTPGTYWVSVQARQDFTPTGQWYWGTRNTQSNDAAAWQNPGDGFGSGCVTWNTRTICIPSILGPDQLYRLNGDLLPPPAANGSLLVVCTETLGYAPNNYVLEISNIVGYVFASSLPAPNEFALFQTHDPWGAAMIKDGITGAGHTYSEFAPAALAGFPFADYRVVILNWDDNFVTDFSTEYTAALADLEAYVNGGGVLWVQASIQGSAGDTFPLPFGGTGSHQLEGTNFIVDLAHPMMAGLANPITGSFASHAVLGGFPAIAHVVKNAIDASGPPTLYELSYVIFVDGFETGDTSRWTFTTP